MFWQDDQSVTLLTASWFVGELCGYLFDSFTNLTYTEIWLWVQFCAF